jgi:hypothetical protein
MENNASDERRTSLETLALHRFPNLTAAEIKLLQAAGRGEYAHCSPNPDIRDPANDPRTAQNWGAERQIRADLVRWLCVHRSAKELVDPLGIQIYAAKILGVLDLSYVTVPFPLILHRCSLDGELNLRCADISEINFEGTWLHSIAADRAQVRNSVFLRNGFHASGQVRLSAARIGGSIECDGGVFENPFRICDPESGIAFTAEGAIVSGSVFLRKGFNSSGEVKMGGAEIGGYFDCTNATFSNPLQDQAKGSGIALNADSIIVRGSVFLHSGFHAEGEVRLPAAQIEGDLDLHNATISSPGYPDNPDGSVAQAVGGANAGGVALFADGAVIKKAFFLTTALVRMARCA